MNNVLEPNLSGPAIAILGIPFDPVTMNEALDEIGRMVASRRPHYVVTANVDFLAQARADVELRRILLDAHLVLCDGTPVIWASRLLGNPLPERVAGSDLVPQLIRIASEKNLRLFFLGGTPDSMKRAIEKVKTEYPSLQIDGYSPPFNQLLEMDHGEIRRRIAEAKPDMLFVSFGCPKQEKWIAMHYQSLGVPVAIGVGGTIDFLAGQLKRAPVWMQRSGTEWMFRLAQEPRRLFKRYARDLEVFGGVLFAQWWTMQFRKASFLPSSNKQGSWLPGNRIKAEADWQWIQLPQVMDAATVRNDELLCDPTLADGRHCLLHADCIEFIDSTGMGWLMRLHKKVRATGRQMVLIAPSPALKHAMELMHLEDFFAIAPDFISAQKLAEDLTLEQREYVRANSFPALRILPKQLVSWRGEITAANAEPVWQATEKLMQPGAEPTQPLVIDLSQVRFMDSSGLGLMVRARKLAKRQGVELSFAGPQPAVLNVLRHARLENYLMGEQP
jgi:N-acetylglucosaminyldiphosphoundecaprenol N-acetyl-beta-D-mannosaminyltransferase